MIEMRKINIHCINQLFYFLLILVLLFVSLKFSGGGLCDARQKQGCQRALYDRAECQGQKAVQFIISPHDIEDGDQDHRDQRQRADDQQQVKNGEESQDDIRQWDLCIDSLTASP